MIQDWWESDRDRWVQGQNRPTWPHDDESNPTAMGSAVDSKESEVELERGDEARTAGKIPREYIPGDEY